MRQASCVNEMSRADRPTQLHELSALEQSDAIKRRELSALDLVEHYLDRITELDSQLGAFVSVTAELARDQARAAERRCTQENAAAMSPLAGVPTAIKDLIVTAGVRARFGSA